MGGSYFILRIDSITNDTVILLTLTLIILPPISIYWLLIRPKSKPKLLVYLTFIVCLGLSYLIIPSSQMGFLNKILIWLIPVLEVSIIIIVVYSILRSVIRYKRNNKRKEDNLLEAIRISLEPDRKSTRLNSSHVAISYAVFC